MWSFYCNIGELKYENRESQAENGKSISMRSFYCNIGKPRYGIRESQAGNQILCNKQFWFRAFIAEIENLKSIIQTGNPKIENGNYIYRCGLFIAIFENQNTEIENSKPKIEYYVLNNSGLGYLLRKSRI